MYKIKRNGHAYGPYTLEQLRHYLRDGLISNSDYVCLNGNPRWFPVGELFSAPPIPVRENAASGIGEATFAAVLVKSTSTAFVTPLLVAVNVIVFMLMLMQGVSLLSPTSQNLISWGADYGPLTTNGQWWRTITSVFVHVGIIHIGLNMYALYAVGRFTERLFGNFGYLVLYLLSGVGGSLASLVWNSQIVSAGASGAIFGVYGGLLAFLILQRHEIPPATLKSLTASTLGFVAFNMIYGVTKQGIDISAHIGGLATGFFAGLVLTQSLHRATSGSRTIRGLIAIVLGAVVLLGVALQIPVVNVESSPTSSDPTGQITPSLGSLSGKVEDPSGAPVPLATVSATGPSGASQTTKTADDGSYKLDSLVPGAYSVAFSSPGFALVTESVTVEASRETAVDVRLHLGSSQGSLSESIRAVLKSDENLSRPILELSKQLREKPELDLDTVKELIAAIRKYVDEASNIELGSCPNDFSEAYREHVKAWSAEAEALASLADGTSTDVEDRSRTAALDDKITDTWKEVEILAERYGAK